MVMTQNGGGASASSPKAKPSVERLSRKSTGDMHPNVFHPNACMVDGRDGSRYCGWLLNGHPWCGTHEHQCEDLPPKDQEMARRGS